MKHLLLALLLLLPVACADDARSVLVPRAPSDDLSVRRFYVLISSTTRLIGEREALPNDTTAFVTVDLV